MQPNPTSGRRFPLILYVILTLAMLLVLAVVLIMTVPIPQHFPPEPPEKIAMRLSPENGFYAVEKAAALIAPFEGIVDWGRSRNENPYLWNRWTTDPEREAELLAYFERAQPAIEKIREGLNADYYLLPEIGDMTMDLSYLDPLREIARILTAQAKYLESRGNDTEAMENYLDTVRFGITVRSDGPLMGGLVALAIESIALDGLNRSLDHYEDVQILQHALDTLKEIAEIDPPPSRVFEFEFRLIENSPFFGAQITPSAQGPGTSPNSGETFLGRAYSLIFYRSRDRYYREFLEAIDKSYLEFEKNPPKIPGDPISKIVFPAFERVHKAFARQEALLDGTMVALALRIHRIEHGTYPDTLDAVVPGYLDALPIDPFTGQSFIYSVEEDDFRLYPQGDQVIHLPRDEWEALEEEK